MAVLEGDMEGLSVSDGLDISEELRIFEGFDVSDGLGVSEGFDVTEEQGVVSVIPHEIRLKSGRKRGPVQQPM